MHSYSLSFDNVWQSVLSTSTAAGKGSFVTWIIIIIIVICGLIRRQGNFVQIWHVICFDESTKVTESTVLRIWFIPLVEEINARKFCVNICPIVSTFQPCFSLCRVFLYKSVFHSLRCKIKWPPNLCANVFQPSAGGIMRKGTISQAERNHVQRNHLTSKEDHV